MVLIVVVLNRGHAMSYRRCVRISLGKEFFLETGVRCSGNGSDFICLTGIIARGWISYVRIANARRSHTAYGLLLCVSDVKSRSYLRRSATFGVRRGDVSLSLPVFAVLSRRLTVYFLKPFALNVRSFRVVIYAYYNL
jgi:hypothetical protein